MASPSPPGSPRDDGFDMDVEDTAVFADHPPLPRQAGEGISLADLMAAEERFGAPELEGEEPAMAVVEEQDGMIAEMSPQDVLNRLLQVAAAPPPFQSPVGLWLKVTFPPLSEFYACFCGKDATDAACWTFFEWHHDGIKDIREMLAGICTAGYHFCARRVGNGDTSPEARLGDLSILVKAVFALQQYPYSRRLKYAGGLELWMADKLNFVVGNMLAVVEGEGAYHGAQPITNAHLDRIETQCLRDRFAAVIDRVVDWPRLIASNIHPTGTLIDSCLDSKQIKVLALAFTQPAAQHGSMD